MAQITFLPKKHWTITNDFIENRRSIRTERGRDRFSKLEKSRRYVLSIETVLSRLARESMVYKGDTAVLKIPTTKKTVMFRDANI